MLSEVVGLMDGLGKMLAFLATYTKIKSDLGPTSHELRHRSKNVTMVMLSVHRDYLALLF